MQAGDSRFQQAKQTQKNGIQNYENILHISHIHNSPCWWYSLQEAQLMLTNPRDAFRGQLSSSNVVSFHMLGIISSCAIVTLTLRY